MKKIVLCLVALCVSMNIAIASDITGRVVDNENKGLIGATIKLLDANNKLVAGSQSTSKGNFELKSIKNGSFNLEITFIGYETINKPVVIKANKDVDLGKINLVQAEILGETVVVEAASTTGELIKDTTQFNAKAFKTAENAVAEDLIKKIPGVEVNSDGTVKAQGETVKKVLVDGKPFFGNDPKVAMKNIPADMIDKVQIFDKNSDNSQFTGKEDDEKEKAINIVTRADKRKGVFGKISGAYGTDDRYSANLSLNIMNDQQRYSVLAMSNNVSIQNFSIGDIMGMSGGGMAMRGMRFGGGMMSGGGAPNIGSSVKRPNFRGGPSDFMVNPSDGISTNHSVGLNYSDVFSDWGNLDGSYFFNSSNNSNTQEVSRNYFAIGDSAYTFNQNGNGDSKNLNHRFNARFTANLDSSNSIMLIPSFTYQGNKMNSYSSAINQYDNNGKKINESKNDYLTNYNGLSFDNDITYVYKFKNPKRNISFSLENSLNTKDGYSLQNSNTTYFTGNKSDTVNQKIDLKSKDYSYDIDLDYVEPITDSSTLRLMLRHSTSKSDLANDANAFNPLTNEYDIMSNLYSSNFSNLYQTNTLGLNYRLKKGVLDFSATLRYQDVSLHSELSKPKKSTIDYNTGNFLPGMRLRFNFDKTNNLNFGYYTFNIAPSATQLSEVLDVSNPLQLYIGNEKLKPQYSNNFHMFYMNMSEDFKKMFHVFGNFSFRNNYISNSYYTAFRDTTIDNINLPAGSQLYKPINMDGFFDSRLFMSYSFPIEALLLKMNFGGGASYNSTPGVINGIENKSNNFGYNANFGINSNVSQDLDYNISTGYNYNITKNTNGMATNYTYQAMNLNFDINWTMFWGIYLTANSYNQFYLSQNYTNNQNVHLLNMSLGVKFLENNAAQIELKAFDVLNRNSNLVNNITDRYTEIVSNNILRRYFLLTFTYNLKTFGGFSSGGLDMPRGHRF